MNLTFEVLSVAEPQQLRCRAQRSLKRWIQEAPKGVGRQKIFPELDLLVATPLGLEASRKLSHVIGIYRFGI